MLANVYFFDEPLFWALMVLTGITGFVINIAIFLQIKFTTPLTNNISGTAKSCVQTALAAWYFANPISVLVSTNVARIIMLYLLHGSDLSLYNFIL